MAMFATKGEVPKGAVELNRKEAMAYQWKQIEEWPHSSESWPFRYGIVALATIASAAGMYINGRYRRKLKLRQYGFVTTSFPMIVGPAMLVTSTHVGFVTTHILLRDQPCSLCLQYRAALLQNCAGVLYPLLLSPIANFLFALRHGTFNLPYWNDYRRTYDLWWKMTKPMGGALLFIAGIQTISAIFVTYMEAKKLNEINLILMMRQEEAKLARMRRRPEATTK